METLTSAQAKENSQRYQRDCHTHAVLMDMINNGERITISSVARNANVSRNYVAGNRWLCDIIARYQWPGLSDKDIKSETIRLRSLQDYKIDEEYWRLFHRLTRPDRELMIITMRDLLHKNGFDYL